VTACGRDALRVVATARSKVPLGDVAEVIIDTETGILLRCAYFQDGQPGILVEFTQLSVHGPASEPPPTEPSGEPSGESQVSGPAWEAFKVTGGLALAGLGALVKYRPHAPADGARAEMPPAEPPAPGPDGDISDEVLNLLYRSAEGGQPFAATLHWWLSPGGALGLIPENGRKAGFGGLGFFADAVTERAGTVYKTAEVRASGSRVYRIDTRDPGKRELVTEACDGHRYWQVYHDRVITGAARPPAHGMRFLDTSWLLGKRLSGATEVTIGGRRAFRLRVEPRLPAFTPTDVIVDAELGVALRQVTLWKGVPLRRMELSDVTPGPVDISVTIPPGFATIEENGDPVHGLGGNALRSAVGLLRRGSLRYRAEQCPAPVPVAVLARVEVVLGELAQPRRPELVGHPRHLQPALGCRLVQHPVDPRDIRHARPADHAPHPGRHRQIEQHGAVRHAADQLPQVREQLARRRVEDVVHADPAGHQVSIGRHPGQLRPDHVAEHRTGFGQVEHLPLRTGPFPQPGQHLPHIAAVRRRGAKSLCGRIAEHHPQRPVPPGHPLVVPVPVVREGRAVRAHRRHAVGPPAEPAGPQPGGTRRAGTHGGHDLYRRFPHSVILLNSR
jgi:hypothetical protein